MPFTPKDWKNSPAQDTALSAEAIEDLETRVTDYTDSELTTHTADTTSVHGIADTSALATDSDVSAAQDAAVPKALLDAKGDLIAASAADTPGRLAVGTNGQVLTADSAQALGVKWAAAGGGGGLPAQQILLSDYLSATDGSYDATTDFQAALDASLAAYGELIIDCMVRLDGTVTASASSAEKRIQIRGFGGQYTTSVTEHGSVIIDNNATGPCLRFSAVLGVQLTPVLRDFDIKLAVDKPAYNMVEFVKPGTGNLVIENVRWLCFDAGHGDYQARAALHIEDLWVGSLKDVRFVRLVGHSLWYECQNANGGNLTFINVYDEDCQNGMFIRGNGTTNNVLFNGCKWYGEQGQTYYEARSSGPGIGATTLQLATGVTAARFPTNGAILIHSLTGTEIVHAAATGTPYNASTGVLTLRDTVTKDHSTRSDVRYIAAPFAVTTAFHTPSMTFNSCHVEGRTLGMFDGSGTFTDTLLYGGAKYTDDDTIRIAYVGGEYSSTYRFHNCRYGHVTGDADNYRMVYGLWLGGALNSGAIDINAVHTYPTSYASQTNTLYQPFDGDANYLANGKYKVHLPRYGTQLNTFDPTISNESLHYEVRGAVAVPSGDTDFIPPRYVSLSDAQTARLVGIRGSINSGTSASVKLQRNGADLGLSDNFTDTNGVDLANHVSVEDLSTWAIHPTATPQVPAYIQSNRVYGSGATSSVYYSSVVPTSADYSVSGVVRRVTTATDYEVSVCGRVDLAATTFYHAQVTHKGTGSGTQVKLFKCVAGTNTQLGTAYEVPGMVDGGDVTVKLEMIGTSIKAYVNGTERIAVTDSSITAAGRAGVRGRNATTTTGYHLDSISDGGTMGTFTITTTPTTFSLGATVEDGDALAPVVTAISATPKNLSLDLAVESTTK